MDKLYGAKGMGGLAPQVIYEEIGISYEKIEIDFEKNENRDPKFLALNPLGQVPALVLSDGTLITESAAMVIHLCDSHPDAGLLPPAGTTERAIALRWLMFMAVNVYTAEQRTFYSDRFTTDPSGAKGVEAAAIADAEKYLSMLEDALKPGPYLLGERYSAVDIYLWMLGTWFSDEVIGKFPRIQRLMQQVVARPAVTRVAAEHEIEG